MAKLIEVFENLSNLGGFVTFDGVNVFQKYDADLVNYAISPGSVSTTYRRASGKSSFHMYNFDFNASTMTLHFYVHGFSQDDAMVKVNGLVRAAKNPIVKFIDDEPDFEYATMLDSYSVSYTEVEWYYDVTVVMKAIRRMKLRTIAASSVTSVTFDNPGTIASGTKVDVVRAELDKNVHLSLNFDDSEVSQDIAIKEMIGNVNFVIDGIDGKVLDRNGVNRILQTDLVKFPKVKPGRNSLKSNKPLSWTISFYPTFEC